MYNRFLLFDSAERYGSFEIRRGFEYSLPKFRHYYWKFFMNVIADVDAKLFKVDENYRGDFPVVAGNYRRTLVEILECFGEKHALVYLDWRDDLVVKYVEHERNEEGELIETVLSTAVIYAADERFLGDETSLGVMIRESINRLF